jgi:hypothetical protein
VETALRVFVLPLAALWMDVLNELPIQMVSPDEAGMAIVINWLG